MLMKTQVVIYGCPVWVEIEENNKRIYEAEYKLKMVNKGLMDILCEKDFLLKDLPPEIKGES